MQRDSSMEKAASGSTAGSGSLSPTPVCLFCGGSSLGSAGTSALTESDRTAIGSTSTGLCMVLTRAPLCSPCFRTYERRRLKLDSLCESVTWSLLAGGLTLPDSRR